VTVSCDTLLAESTTTASMPHRWNPWRLAPVTIIGALLERFIKQQLGGVEVCGAPR
jgi:hypothetical protein